MKMFNKKSLGGGRNSHKTVRTASVLILTVVFALVLSGAVSAGTPLQTNQNGTVSGDLYVNTTDGWPSSTQGATNEVTQANTLPTYTSIDSAWVYVNVYSGSGTNNWPVRTTVKIDANGDGDYDDPGELLGVEDMNIPGTTDGTVYWLNDHCNRVYSDYQVWYDVKNLITSNNPTLYVKTETIGGDGYDGRIKLLALCVAYNDGDTDQVDYWGLNGQDWINSDTSPSTSTFNTSSFTGQVSSATLNTVALSGTDGTYTLNGNSLSGNLTETGSYYKEHIWDVTGNITSGADTTLTYTNVGSSLKMNFATLTIREAPAAPVANFTSNVTSGYAPLNVTFTDTSNNATGWNWDFNYDTVIDSTSQNPTWIYSTPGTYTVSLTVTGPGGINTIIQTGYITVAANGLADTAWPKFGLNSKNTGQSPYGGPQTNNLVWTYTTGGKIYGSLAIAADGTIYIGSQDKKLYALNSNGTLKWSYTTGGIVYSSLAIAADGTIYIGSQDKKLYALNSNGTLKWSYTTGGAIYSSPAIDANGTIYIGNCDDGKLYALNPDGTLKWTHTTGGPIQDSAAIATDGTIYIGGNDGKIYALNPDGTLKWTYTTGGVINYASPAIGADGTIYIGNYSDHKIYALNPDGTLKWTYTTGNYIDGSLAIGADGTIYIGSMDKKLHALNPDGTLKWSYTTGNYVLGAPVVGADGIIYIGSYDKKLYALNPDGTLKWSYTTGGSFRQVSPAISADGTLYIGNYDGKLYAFRDPVMTPVTNFTSSVVSGVLGIVPLTVQFTDTSSNHPTSWLWEFGDGNTSTQPNPIYTYINPGSYTVKLTVTNEAGGDDEIKTDYITLAVDTTAPTATANPTGGELTSAIQVTLNAIDDLDPNPLIYYTLDGTETTTNSTKYTNSITINKTSTLKFIAIDSTSNTSPVQTETYTDNQAPNVSANPTGGELSSAIQVVLSASDNVSSVIYYTLDGSNPTTNSTPYTNPITINKTTTLKFIAIDPTGNTSTAQTETYTDTQAPNVSANPTTETSNSLVHVTLSATDNVDSNPKIYYTTDGSNPTTSSTPYTIPISIPVTTTLKFIAVDISGNVSTVRSETYTINDTEAPTVTITPAGGTYTTKTQVILNTNDNVDPNPAIYYTFDGTDPTTSSTHYTGSFYIPGITTTLKFFAVDASGNVSAVQTEIYTMVDTEAPSVTASYDSGHYEPVWSYPPIGSAFLSVNLTASDNVDSDPSIFYTLDGSDPTTSSTPYSSPVPILPYNTTTLKFIAVDAMGNISPVQNRTYNTYIWNDRYVGGRFNDGHDTVNNTVYVEGNIGVRLLEYGGYGWFRDTGTGTATWTASDLNIPTSATLISARLYQARTWYGTPNYTIHFNGHDTQQPIGYYWDYIAGQNVFDVAQYFNLYGDNTAIITGGAVNYGTILVVIYEAPSEPYRQIWINEGADCLNGEYSEPPFVSYTVFNNVNTTNLASAQITTVLLSGSEDLENALFNGQNIPITSLSGTDPGIQSFNVTTALQNGTNELGVRGSNHSSYFNFAIGVLEVTQQTVTAPVADFTATPTLGTAPLQVQFNDTSTNTPTSWLWEYNSGSGWTTFASGTDSAAQNPQYIFTTPGTYDIRLTATNSVGSDDEIKLGFITVKPGITNPRTGQIYTNIQGAIADALDGDTLTLQNGTYTENITINKQLTLNSAGAVTIQAANVDLPVFNVEIAGSGSNITGFTITGATNSCGINLDFADNCNINNNVISGNLVGVKFFNSNQNNLSVNTIQNNTWAGICLDLSTGETINANEVTGNQEGIFLANSSTCNVIQGNNIHNNTGTGVNILSNSNSNTITGNTMSGNGVMGLLVQNSNNNTVAGNTVQNNGWAGIVLDQATGNTINNSNEVSGSHEGIFLANNSNNNIITGNNIHNNTGVGVSILNSNSNQILSNTASSNGMMGIFIQNSNTNTISGNTVQNNGWTGICLDNSTSNIINTNVVTGNQEGIFLANNSSTNTIENNQTNSNTGNGICILNSNSNTINTNQVNNNGISGIFIQNSTSTVIYHNTLESNWGGVVLDTTTSTIVHQNNFINNTEQAMAANGTGNKFYQNTTGNYYNDWTTTQRRIIDGNENTYDHYPKTIPF